MQGSARVKIIYQGAIDLKRVVDPLLGDAYDYMVFDCPSYPGMLNNNALVATGNVVIPFEPEASSIGGYQRTMERLIDPAREFIDAEVLAVVPNKIDGRIDQRTEDRELLENLDTATADVNEDVPLHDVVPSFARITADEFEAIGAGEVRPRSREPAIGRCSRARYGRISRFRTTIRRTTSSSTATSSRGSS